MKLLTAAAVVLLLAGCATMPQRQVEVVHRAAPVVKPVKPETPNQAVKKRWFSGYKIKLWH